MGVLPLVVVERRVNALATGWMVYAVLIALTGVVGMFFAQAWMAGHMGAFGPWNGHPMWHGPVLPHLFLRLGWLFLIIRVAFAAAAGYGLMQKASWGRWVAIIAGILTLFHFPFGTAMGVWTLVVLLSVPNAAGYEAMVRE
jgi:hypothetical protein